MNRLRKSRSTLHGQRGVTLVELMISMLLGLLLTAGIIQIFIGNRVTYAFNDGLSRIQENARFALDLIAYETRMAGYKGCISDVAIHNNLNPGTTIDFALDLQNGVQGHEAGGGGTWSPVLPSQLSTLPINGGRPIAGSDILIVRGVSSDANALVSPFTNSAQVFVSEPHDFVDGDILVTTDCQKASIFQVTKVQPAGAVGINLEHAQAGGFFPGNNVSNWGTEQDYGLGAEVARLQARAFYVGTGVNGPALFQLRLQSSVTSDFAAEAIAEDIDTMQVRYGVDLDNNGAIDRWDTANAVNAAGNWARVLSVEVTLLARSEEYGTERDTTIYNLGGGATFNGPNDRRLRQVFSTTIGVRNRLP